MFYMLKLHVIQFHLVSTEEPAVKAHNAQIPDLECKLRVKKNGWEERY